MNGIQVIATTFDGTCAAIEAAVLLARASRSPLTVLVPKIVPYALPQDDPADGADAVLTDYRQLLDEFGSDGRVRLCVCRGIDELIDRLTPPDATVVVGGPCGRWRLSPEQRFANRLSRVGRRVLFASTGPSTTARRQAIA